MHKNIYSSFLVVIIIVGSLLKSQTVTNNGYLENFANDKHNEYLRNQKEIEEFAAFYDIPIRQELADGTVLELHHIEKGTPYYYITLNAGAAQTTRADELYIGGSVGSDISGYGYSNLGLWDAGGVLTTHQEFGNRVIQKDTPGSTHFHATHVAGTLVAEGVDAAAKGMVYQANLDAYDWNDDKSEMALAGAVGMEESNHSYGFVRGWFYNSNDGYWYWYGDINYSTDEDVIFGHYSSNTADWDEISYNAPFYLITMAAGNDRGNYHSGWHYHWVDGSGWTYANDVHGPDGGTDGHDCLLTKGCAKNILTVGAVEEVINYAQPSDVIMSYFSGWGPTDDGRIKPDIVGKGVGTYSTDNDNNTDYRTLSGTSMASPNVAGTLALLQQHYQNTHSTMIMRAATLKGLVIHAADEAGPNQGPDYMFGWGLPNGEEAGRLISLDSYGNNIIDEQVLANGSSYSRIIKSDGTKPIKVTICWTDPAGTPVTSDLLNNRAPMLVNNLDLKITKGGTTYYPWKLDPDNPANAASNSAENNVDNVEQVYIASPSQDSYTIIVSHDDTLSGGGQAFSIIVSGENYCINGSVIYNTNINKFNFCEDGLWVEK